MERGKGMGTVLLVTVNSLLKLRPSDTLAFNLQMKVHTTAAGQSNTS